MTDTPQGTKDLQLKIWLSKTPGERLHQMMKDNEELINFWKQLKASAASQPSPSQSGEALNNLPSK